MKTRSQAKIKRGNENAKIKRNGSRTRSRIEHSKIAKVKKEVKKEELKDTKLAMYGQATTAKNSATAHHLPSVKVEEIENPKFPLSSNSTQGTHGKKLLKMNT
jgi:hypothetical protein